jgi:hypothetical protein
MNLSDLAKKPQLIKISLDDEETVKEFGEPIEFWTWDRQPMDTFLKLASMSDSNYGTIVTAVKGLIMDETGREILGDGETLPSHIMMRVVNRLVTMLGK